MLQAIVLGLVQGLTEFLPVSSSGHLVIVPYLLSWEQPPLAFDVALHFGTLVAVVAFFLGDLWWLGTRSLGIGARVEGEAAKARRTVALLAVGSVPAALAGVLFEDLFESTFAEPRLVAGFLLVTALLLWGAEHLRRRRVAADHGKPVAELTRAEALADPGRHEGTTGFVDSVVVGGAQALAIFPGISRSGATIAAGMGRGLSREAAARFSFLLSVPIILGATISKAGEMLDATRSGSAYTGSEILVGTAVAAVSGYWAIRFLLRLVSTDELTGFARYVVLLSVLTFVGTLWLGPPGTI